MSRRRSKSPATRSREPRLRDAPRLRAFTVATGQSGYFDALVRSCERHGIDLEVLGQGAKWRGFVWRLRLLHERLAKLPDDELVIVTDGYDTMIMSDASELRAAYAVACNDQRLADATDALAGRKTPNSGAAASGDLKPMVLAPENPREWCTTLFSHTFVRASFSLYGLDRSHPYVVNAGVLLAPVRSVRAYYESIFAESEATGNYDDQWLLNRLFWSHRLPVPVAVDKRGSVAYCHANRDAISYTISTFIDQNRHLIRHSKQLELEAGGALRVKRSGSRVGVLHAITNADVDALCTQ